MIGLPSGQICLLLSSIIKVRSLFNAKVKHVCLQPIVKNVGSLSLGSSPLVCVQALVWARLQYPPGIGEKKRCKYTDAHASYCAVTDKNTH